MKMKKPMSKTKDSVRVRRERNLVAKHNRNKGGYHTSRKYERPANADWTTTGWMWEEGKWEKL